MALEAKTWSASADAAESLIQVVLGSATRISRFRARFAGSPGIQLGDEGHGWLGLICRVLIVCHYCVAGCVGGREAPTVANAPARPRQARHVICSAICIQPLPSARCRRKRAATHACMQQRVYACMHQNQSAATGGHNALKESRLSRHGQCIVTHHVAHQSS